MENEKVKYTQTVTTRAEPVIITKERYEELLKIKVEYDLILSKLKNATVNKEINNE